MLSRFVAVRLANPKSITISDRGRYTGDNSPDGSFPHEAFSSDGTGGAFAGLIHSATAGSIEVPGAANGGYVGGAVAILNGRGRGQVRKVASVVNPPPPPVPPPGPFPDEGWIRLAGHNGSQCLPAAKPNMVAEGDSTPAECIQKCAANAACNFATIEFFPPTRPGGGYCELFLNCSSIGGWDAHPCTLPPPHTNRCVPQNNITANIATYKRPPNLPGAAPVYGKYVLEEPWDIQPDATSFATVIPYVGHTIVMGPIPRRALRPPRKAPELATCAQATRSTTPRLCRSTGAASM